MRPPSIMLAAAAVAAALAGPAAAQDPNDADIHCAVAAIALANSATDQTVKGQAGAALLYFIGRIDGRSPNLDLEPKVRAELAKLNPQDVGPTAMACGQQLMGRIQALQAMGERMKGAAPAAPASPPASPH